MFDFLKPKPQDEAAQLVDELAGQQGRNYPFKLKNFPAGLKIENAVPELQRGVALALIGWMGRNFNPNYNQNIWKMREAFFDLLKRKLPFTEADLIIILDWAIHQNHNYFRGTQHIIKAVDFFLKGNSLGEPLRKKLRELIQVIEKSQPNIEDRRRVLRIRELLGESETTLPITPADVWSSAVLAEIKAMPAEKQNAWAELLLHCLRASGSAPSSKWMKDADRFVESLGRPEFFSALGRWFPLVNEYRPETGIPLTHRNPDWSWMLEPVNCDVLKGLVWLSSKSDSAETARFLTALAVSTYRKIPQVGPRAAKVGNACFWALGNMPGNEGVAQLSILKIKIKMNSAQNLIANALETAAKRMGLSADEVEELSVPSYGLDEVGFASITLEDAVCEIRVDGVEVEQNWMRGGKKLASAPKNVKEQYPDELKEIAQSVKDIRKMLPAQKDRIENLYLAQKKWTLATWQARYLDHPLVGTIARRLIWKFSRGDRAASGIWLDGRIMGRNDAPLEWLDDETTVELWHPLHVETEVVLGWRAWLMRHEVRQPFKQAHREIYVLTDAERNTHTYSNRYAAHILRQHQFNALCAARGWKNALRLLVDADFPPASRALPAYGLRAEYWVEGIGTNYGADTNDTGTFLYLTTDQVRFYRIDATENRAHASGGGYSAPRWNGAGNAEPLPLEQIPPLVFSEIFRDVDLFVGVASVGNDPTWIDSGGEVRYRDYWHSFSFGELGESAKTRKQLLEFLLPRLKIAERCKLVDKFLVVRGDLRTYKIHLGSSNILMEPNDQYLCIVPSRGTETGTGKLFLPFEGDQTMAVILSKAFLLAEDKKITDPTITRQIKR
jgi:hypothetical protein